MAEDKVNAIWTTINGNATVTFPSGLTHQFDLKKLNKEVLFLFGGKKWLQNESASCKTDQEKIDTMKASYKEAVEKGLETSETGKVRIIGATRKNATITPEEKAAAIKAYTITAMREAVKDASPAEKKMIEGIIAKM
jgi:hypothetical protein